MSLLEILDIHIWMPKFINLKKISFDTCFDVNKFDFLQNLIQLEYIHFGATLFSDSQVHNLLTLTNLSHLSIWNSYFLILNTIH